MKISKIFMLLCVLIMAVMLTCGTVAFAAETTEETTPSTSEETTPSVGEEPTTPTEPSEPTPTEPSDGESTPTEPTEDETPTEPTKPQWTSGLDILSEIWTYIVGCLGGISLTGIISAIIYGALKGAFNKTIQKIDVEKISQNATEKGIEKVREVSFSHSIQPIVEARLTAITEVTTQYLDKQLATMREEYNKLLNILEALASYFDYSIGVSEQAKEQLHKALVDARTAHLGDQSVTSDEVIIKDEKTAQGATESPKTQDKTETEPVGAPILR